MDKYEYKLKAEEIVRLAGKKQYKAAAKLADDIRWEKVKNIQMLCTVSEIYERIGKYDDSRDVLGLAYTRSPNSKTIVYRMTKLSIALKDYQEATDLYHEYVQLAPNDSNVLTLKYRLYKGRGAKLDTLIAILEEFKSRDYQEEWILELARLYHQAGDVDKCVDICNEIDLWFNEGPSVIKALELKKQYTALTPMQERKLKNAQAAADKPKEKKERMSMPAAEGTRKEPDGQDAELKSPPYLKSESENKPESYTKQEPSAKPEMYVKPEFHANLESNTKPEIHANQECNTKPEIHTNQESHAKPGVSANQEPYAKPEHPNKPDSYSKSEFHIEPDSQQKTQTEPVPPKREERAQRLPDDVPLAEALIRMARPETDKELKRGFSILPKGKVVTGNSEEFAFDLPNGVEEVEIHVPDKELRQSPAPTAEEKPITNQKEHMFDTESSQDETNVDQTDQEDWPETQEDVSEEEFKDDYPEEKPVRHSMGLLEKVFSRLKLDDDEMEDDFKDDYEDEDEEEESTDQEKGMVSRGLTGQYEKVVIEDEEDEDDDPLNVWMKQDDEDEEEYEYAYGDEDEEEEYEEITDEEDEEPSEARTNKRFHFFRNTMAEDESYEEEDSAQDEEEVIPLSYAAKYDTLNLQKELAKSIQQLMDATEKETVDSTLENVKKLVQESHIPELTETMRFKAIRGGMLNHVARRQAEKLEQARDIEEVVAYHASNPEECQERFPAEDATVVKADARPKPMAEFAIKLKPVEEEQYIPIEKILTQEDDGQLSILMPEQKEEEKQIEGQLNFEDVLREWEKQELLSENDREKRALEEARKRALEETQDIMTEIMVLLKDVIPKIGSIKDGEEKMSDLAQSLERIQKSLPFTENIVQAAEESKEAASAIEAACAEAVIELERMEGSERGAEAEEEPAKPVAADAVEDEVRAWGTQISEDQDSALPTETVNFAEEDDEYETPDRDIQAVFQNLEQSLQEEIEESRKRELLAGMDYLKEQAATDFMYAEDGETAQGLMPEQDLMDEGYHSDDSEPYEQEYLSQNEMGNAYEETAISKEASNELLPEMRAVVHPGDKFGSSELKKSESVQSGLLNEEQKEILAYFLSIRSIQSVLETIVKKMESSPEHMIITGEEGSGKTSVAMRIIKAAQVKKPDKIDAIAKIQAALLNQKKISEILKKVDGGVLIIEKAGSLKPSTVYAIEDALYSNQFYIQIIFVDNKAEMSRLLRSTRSFINDIQMRVDLPVYSNNELVEFARKYADVNGYAFDGMAILALHSAIDLFQTDQHAANLEDVKNIMNEAMEQADKRNSKLFGKLFGKKNTDGVILLESDFE